jgi:hypothetical protein
MPGLYAQEPSGENPRPEDYVITPVAEGEDVPETDAVDNQKLTDQTEAFKFEDFGVEDLREEAIEPETPQNLPEDKPFFKRQDLTVDPGAADLDLLIEKMLDLEKEVDRLRESVKIRKKLELSDEEQHKKEKEILEAVSRDYTLGRERTLGVDYSGYYSYTSSDRVNLPRDVQHQNSHSFQHSVSAYYSIMNNVSLSTSIPFLYKYDKTGTDDPITSSGIGNISFGLNWQPARVTPPWPSAILSVSYAADTGKGPYDINPEEELPTASGYDSISAGLSLSKPIDPIVVYGSMGYSFPDEITGINANVGGEVLTKVKTGGGLSFSSGIGFSLSYVLSLNFGFSYSYTFPSRSYFESGTQKSGTGVSASFNVGTGWRLSPKRSLSVGLGIGLTNNAADMTLSVRMPFSFKL